MSLSELEAARNEANRLYSEHQRRVDDEIRAAAYAASSAVRAKHEDETARLQTALREAQRAVQEHVDQNASHPWEGKRVKNAIHHRDWRGVVQKDRPPKSVEYGVVQIRRTGTSFPANASNLPMQGEAFVRLLKKDGSLGAKFSRLSGWKSSNWELAE